MSLKTVIVIDLILSISFGFVDAIINSLKYSPEFASFQIQFVPVVFAICFLFLFFLIFSLALKFLLKKLFNLKEIPFYISASVFFCTGIIFAFQRDLIHVYLGINDILNLLLVVFESFLISIGVYFVAEKNILNTKLKNALSILSISLPFVLGETFLFVWLESYEIEYLSSKSFIAFLCFIFIVIFTVWVASFIHKKEKVFVFLIIFICFLILSLLFGTITSTSARISTKEIKSDGHSISYIILITVDSLRSDCLSCYNTNGFSTKNIDELAKNGILFTNVFSSAPWTLPSVASIMTGMPPLVHLATKERSKLSNNFYTLAETLQDMTYYTAAIGDNPVLKSHSNIGQGFIEYNIFPKNFGDSVGTKICRKIFPTKYLSSTSTEGITYRVNTWIKKNAGKDFFLWIHYLDPHLPYEPPKDFLPELKPDPNIGTSFTMSDLMDFRRGYYIPTRSEKSWIKKLYTSEIRYVDDNIDKIIKTLKNLKIYNDCLIILTSDHGEEFWEHNGLEHGHSLYNELLRVPLIIRLPGSIQNKRIDTFVSLQSIASTILDLCGIKTKKVNFPAASLSSLWQPNHQPYKTKPIVSMGQLYYKNQISIIFEGLKYIRDYTTNREEFYDLENDPFEQSPLIITQSEKIKKAKDYLVEYSNKAKRLREYYRIGKDEKIKFNKKIQEELRALGYIK